MFWFFQNGYEKPNSESPIFQRDAVPLNYIPDPWCFINITNSCRYKDRLQNMKFDYNFAFLLMPIFGFGVSYINLIKMIIRM